jgi:hypothetical protein
VDTSSATAPARLALDAGVRIGRVGAIDADRVAVVVDDPAMVPSVTISDLVAMPATDGFLMGIVGGLSRLGDDGTVLVEVMPVGTFHPGLGRAGSFRLGATRHPPIDTSCHLVDGEQLKRFMSLLGDDVGPDERLVLGNYVAERDTPAVADANRLLQRHVAILGNTGSGKSWTIAALLHRAGRLRHANVIVLDMHGEYAPLTDPSDGSPPLARRLRIAGPADLLYAGEDILHVPYWLLEREELLSLVLNESDPHAADQRLCLNDRVQTLKRSALVEMGAHDAVATATVDSPVPYSLQHLMDWLQRDEVDQIVRQPSGRVDPGPYHGKLGGLISRLEARIADPRYGFIFHPPEHTSSGDWLVETAGRLLAAGPGETGIKVIDLSEVPAAVLPMVAGVLARLVYNVQFWMEPATRTPVCLVCDEAHLYLPAHSDVTPVQRVALEAFEMIAKEGRKYGVCLAVVSQRPSDVSRTILSQCNNFVVMRLTNDEDQEVVAHLLPAGLAGIRGVLPMLDVGEAVIVGDALLLPLRIRLDPPAVAPASATLPYWSMWSTKPSDPEAIAAGVDALRVQWRGPAA